MRVLVVGGRGFIGRAIVAELTGKGADVVVGTRSSNTGPDAMTVRLHERRSDVEWRHVIAEFDVVVNAAGILRQRWRESYARVHCDAPAAIARASAALGKRFIHVSALGLRASAGSRFIRSKYEGEKAILAAGGDSIIVRAPLLDGAGGYGATWLRQLSLLPIWLLPADPDARLSPLPVTELAVAIAKLVYCRDAEPIVELGGTREMTFLAYLTHLRGNKKSPPVAAHLPRWIGRLLAHVCDVLHLSPYSYGHFELLQKDNLPQPNQFFDIVGRSPASVSCRVNRQWLVPTEGDAEAT